MRLKSAFPLVVATSFLVAATVLLAAACGGTGLDGGDSEVREVPVRATDDLRFEPSEMRLRRGQSVRLMMENMGDSVHDFTVDEMPMMGGGTQGGPHDMGDGMNMDTSQYAMHMAVQPHRDGVMEFTPTESGSYTYYCTTNGHREAGMEGTIVVE